MFRLITLAVVLVLSCLRQTSCVSDAAVYSESLIELEHFLSGQFLGRSRYVIKHKIDGNHEINVFDSSSNGISTNQIPEFKNLLSNNGLYRIQVVSKLENGESSSVSAAIPVCDLQQSGFKEDIVLHLDSNDNVISISYSSPVMAISQPCNANKITSEVAFQTRINVAEVEVAQSVPLQALGPKPASLNHINFGADADPSAVPQQSFLRQYWYIVVPMMIIMLMGGGNGEEK